MAGDHTDKDGGRDARGDGAGLPSEGDLAARLQRLEAQIDRKRPAAATGSPAQPKPQGGPSPLGQALRLSTEFTAGVLAGGLLGWLFDRLLGTKPWGLIVLLLLGFVTGVYNVMRVSGRAPQRVSPDRTTQTD